MQHWLQLMAEALPSLLWAGLIFTIPLTLLSFCFGLILGLITAIARLFGPAPVAIVARFYVWVIRGTPLLVQLFVIFFGLGSIGLVIDPWPAAIVALSLNVGGYAAEIVRAAILSVPKGQWEAGHTVGFSQAQTLTRIVLPQAARVSVPPLSNTFISLVKDTSLASTILVTELLRKAQEIAAPTYEFFTLYTVAAVYYWVICLALSFSQSRLEVRLDRYVAI